MGDHNFGSHNILFRYLEINTELKFVRFCIIIGHRPYNAKSFSKKLFTGNGLIGAVLGPRQFNHVF